MHPSNRTAALLYLAVLGCGGGAASADVQRTLMALTGDSADAGRQIDGFREARLNQAGEVVYGALRTNDPDANRTCGTALPIGVGSVTVFELPGSNPQGGGCSWYQYNIWFACSIPESGGYRVEILWRDYGGGTFTGSVMDCATPVVCSNGDGTPLWFSGVAGTTAYIVISRTAASTVRRTGAFRVVRQTNPPSTHVSPETNALYHATGAQRTLLLQEGMPVPFDPELTMWGLDSIGFAGTHVGALVAPQTAPAYIRSRLGLVGIDATGEAEPTLEALDVVPLDSNWTPFVPGEFSIGETGQYAWVDAAGRTVFYGPAALAADEPVPGLPGVTFERFEHPSQSRSGHVVLKARLAGEGVLLDQNSAAVFRDVGNGAEVVVRAGDLMASIGHDVTIASLGSEPSINDEGAVTIAAKLAGKAIDASNDGVILTTRSGELLALVREGEPAWGVANGARFGQLWQTPRMNNAGDIAFVSTLVGEGIDTTNNTGIWTSTALGRNRLLAREGDAVRSSGTDVAFASFSEPALNARGDAVFVATLRGGSVVPTNNRALFFCAPNGHLSEIVRTGQLIEIGPEDVRTVMSFGFEPGRDSDGSGQFNDSGTVLYRVWFTDRSEGLFTAKVTCAADFDGSGVVGVPDIFAYLSAWFSLEASAEWDGNEGIDSGDLFAYLARWFAGC